MKTNFYLKVNSNGSVSVSKGRPSTRYDEIAIGCGLVLPDQLFLKPQINATITVDSKNVMPTVITAETANLVKDAIQCATGMDIKLTVLNPEQ